MDEEKRRLIIQLLSRSVPKREIAEVLGISRASLHKLIKSDPEIAVEVEKNKNETVKLATQIVAEREENRVQELTEKLRDYGDRRRETAAKLQVSGLALLEKLSLKIDSISVEDLKIRDIAPLLRACCELIQQGGYSEADCLGIEQIFSQLADSRENEG